MGSLSAGSDIFLQVNSFSVQFSCRPIGVPVPLAVQFDPCSGPAGVVGADIPQVILTSKGFALAMFPCWFLACLRAPALLRSNLLCDSADAAP